VTASTETSRRRRVRTRLPVDLALTLFPLQRAGRWDPAVRIGRHEAWRATSNPEGPATVRYARDGDAVEVEAWGPGAELELERAAGVLGAEDSLDGFVPHHPLVADLHRRYPGLRITRTRAVFEVLVPAVFEQKVIGAEARAGYGRMIRRLGQPAPGPSTLLVPPDAARMAATPYFDFHQFAIERRRAETMIAAARRGTWLEATVDMTAGAARARLVSLPGIGAWTAAEVAMVALGDADAVSVGDYNLPNLVAWAFRGQRRGDDAMMLELLEPYRGHRGRVQRLLMAGGSGPPRRGPRLALRRLELG
jgi:3-methyladenine DNA glycosylase/8-oxoguanine DNA glycosylase